MNAVLSHEIAGPGLWTQPVSANVERDIQG